MHNKTGEEKMVKNNIKGKNIPVLEVLDEHPFI